MKKNNENKNKEGVDIKLIGKYLAIYLVKIVIILLLASNVLFFMLYAKIAVTDIVDDIVFESVTKKEEEAFIYNHIGQEVKLGYEKGVEKIQGDVEAGSVNVDNTKEYMINAHIQIIKEKGPILFYNQEENDYKIKAKLELIKEEIISETEKKQHIVKVIETEEVSPGYFIETIEVKGLVGGYYPTRVEIVKVLEDGTEETLDKMGLMIEIRD